MSLRHIRALIAAVGLICIAAMPAVAIAKAPDYGDATFKLSSTYTALANRWAKTYNGYLGVTLGSAYPYKIVVGTSKDSGSNPYVPGTNGGDATPLSNTNGEGDAGAPPSICRVRMFPATVSGGFDVVQAALVHEVFHCFQFYLLGDRVWSGSPNAWVDEGLATWAASTVLHAAGDPDDDSSLLRYIETPTKPLFQRDYDAVGFWGHVQDVSNKLWQLIPQIYAGPTDDLTIFNLVGGNSPEFLSTWGASMWRLRQSPAWNMISPVEPKDQTALPEAKVATGSSDHFSVPAYATYQTYLKAPDDMPLMHVEISSYARLDVDKDYVNDGTNQQLQDAWFCADSSSNCTCPTGDTGTAPATNPVSPVTELALTGDPTSGTDATITYESLDDYCHAPPTSAGNCSGPKSGCKLYAGSGTISGGFTPQAGAGVSGKGSFQFCLEVDKKGNIDSAQSQWALSDDVLTALATTNGAGAEGTASGSGTLSGSLTRGVVLSGTLDFNITVTVDGHTIPANSSESVNGLLPISHRTTKGFSGDVTVRNQEAQQQANFDTDERGPYTAKLVTACAVAQPGG